ncbi:MAG: LamG-like jellyroll fold domain-containing protein [Saprospiraceae bacterium]
MRIFFLLLLLGLQYSLAGQSEKLEAYFSFENCKLADNSGNGSSGAILGDTNCVCGVRDEALYFDGNGDALLLVGPLADIFTTSDFSIGFYMRLTDTAPIGGTQVVMAKQANCNTQDAFWIRYAQKTNTISSSISENDTLIATVQAKLPPNRCWYYITVVRSNTRYSLYVDGVLRDSKTSKARVDLTSTAPLKIAEPVCPIDPAFHGTLDELRFYSKALTPDEINRHNLRPDEILNGDTLIYLGNSFQITTAQSCAQTFKWQPSTGVSDPNIANPVITPAAPTTYQLTTLYTDATGVCKSIDSLFVNVIDPDTLDCDKIFIPNAFTPGSSAGRNDVFGISNPYAVNEFISFEIFDRWGGRVFAAEDASSQWDGSAQGQPLNPGVYLYRLHYKCTGQERVKTGSLTLLR